MPSIRESGATQPTIVLIMVWGFRIVDAGMRRAAIESHDSSLMQATTLEAVKSDSLMSASRSTINTLQVAYAVSVAALALIVISMYWKHGAGVIIRVLLYLASLSTVKMSVRRLFKVYLFDFPQFLTGLHLLLSGLFCCMMLMMQSADKRSPTPSWRCMFVMILPISLAFGCSIAAGNAALVDASTSFVEMVSSSTPVCTVSIAVLFNQPFHQKLMWPVVLTSIGLVLCASGAVEFSMLGFVFSMLATLLRSLKAVLQQILMVGQNAQLQPLELLAWVSVPSVVFMLGWSLATEGLQPYYMLAEGSYGLMISIGLTCVNAVILNVMATFVVKDLGAVGAQLCGQLKGLLTVLGGMAVLEETVLPQQAAGYGLVLLGVFWYTQIESQFKAKGKEKTNKTLHEDSPLLQNSSCGGAQDEPISRSTDAIK